MSTARTEVREEAQDDIVSWDVSREDAALVRRIVTRAAKLSPAWRPSRDERLSLTMDIEATHANGCPLRLADLLAADDFNFAHDVWGIQRHINRTTGKLGNCFRPRFAQRRSVEDDA